MVGFLNVCRFSATAGGLTDWTVSSAVTGYQTPSSAGAVSGTVYAYRAESADLTQWEVGIGAYTTGTGVLARSTVRASSTGGKVNFSAAPQVAIVGLAEEVANLSAPNVFTDATDATGAGITASGIFSGGVEIMKRLFVAGGTIIGPIARDPINAALQMANQVLHIGVGPTFSTKCTGGGPDQKFWDVVFSPTLIAFRALNDAYSAASSWLLVNRGSGFTIANVTVPTRLVVSDTTASSSTTTGALTVAGGVGVAGVVVAGASVAVTSNPSSAWSFDTGGQTALVVANGSTGTIPTGSGLVIVRMGEGIVNGAVFLCSGGTVALLGQTGNVWEVNTSTPASGHASVIYVGSNYTIYNNQGVSQNFHITSLRCYVGN